MYCVPIIKGSDPLAFIALLVGFFLHSPLASVAEPHVYNQSTYDMRMYRAGQQHKAKEKVKNPDTQILDYAFSFGAVSYDKELSKEPFNQYRSYSPRRDPDLLPGYHNRRVTSFQRKDELGPFPRGEAIMVRWTYKNKIYKDDVDLKELLSDIKFDDDVRLHEAKTGFHIFVKVIEDEILIYTSRRGESRKLVYSRHIK